ncbi:MAG: NUDIX hydrolase [Syntrophales bacterium]|nr:NUDIX hydrolase [Syntrophales bacterium]
MSKIKPWPLIESRYESNYRIFSLRRDRVRSPRTNGVYDFFTLETPAWVNIIPITKDGQVVMVRQWRHGIREMTLEIPGGMVEGDADPREAAVRELREETGYESTDIISLGFVHPNPAIQNNACHTFLALDCELVGPPHQDEKEDIAVELVPLKDIPRLIFEGVISHALVICAFFRYTLWKEFS